MTKALIVALLILISYNEGYKRAYTIMSKELQTKTFECEAVIRDSSMEKHVILSTVTIPYHDFLVAKFRNLSHNGIYE